MDTKKKELVGDFKNGGREWQPEGEPEEVRVHDFLDKELGKAIPYGVYDMTRNEGWVSVGIDHDTAEFAVETHPALVAARWASQVYPEAERAADHGRRRREQRQPRPAVEGGAAGAWPTRLGLRISVCHFPPGTSKWNKIEHRMFCHITQNWRGRPLVSREVVVNLIGNTTTETGLKIQAELDTGSYPTGIKVTDEELAAVKITRDEFHGEWNYSIQPGKRKK